MRLMGARAQATTDAAREDLIRGAGSKNSTKAVKKVLTGQDHETKRPPAVDGPSGHRAGSSVG